MSHPYGMVIMGFAFRRVHWLKLAPPSKAEAIASAADTVPPASMQRCTQGEAPPLQEEAEKLSPLSRNVVQCVKVISISPQILGTTGSHPWTPVNLITQLHHPHAL